MCITTSWCTNCCDTTSCGHKWKMLIAFCEKQNSARSKAKNSTGGLCCRNRTTYHMHTRDYQNNSELNSWSQWSSTNLHHLPKQEKKLVFFRPAFIGAVHHPLPIIHFLLYCPPCFITVSLMLYEINFARL